MSVYYIVSIVLHPGMGEVLRQYEIHAARVMQRHGGQFVYVLKPSQTCVLSVSSNVQVWASYMPPRR